MITITDSYRLLSPRSSQLADILNATLRHSTKELLIIGVDVFRGDASYILVGVLRRRRFFIAGFRVLKLASDFRSDFGVKMNAQDAVQSLLLLTRDVFFVALEFKGDLRSCGVGKGSE